MQIYKVIPSNPNIVQVRNTLAVYGGLTVDTRDLGTLCAKARTGGTGGYAFNIVENGGAINDGYLINGAEPCFNKWADKSPGEWVLPSSYENNVLLRLKRKFNGIRHGFDLLDFALHDIEAPAPTPFGL